MDHCGFVGLVGRVGIVGIVGTVGHVGHVGHVGIVGAVLVGSTLAGVTTLTDVRFYTRAGGVLLFLEWRVQYIRQPGGVK